jgi:tetratricopeptide (TPR) repeat protein
MESKITDEHDLDQKTKTLWLKALSALELRNLDYAIDLLASVVESQPTFLDGRRTLRKATIERQKGKRKLLSLSGGGISGMKIQSVIKKDPLLAMVECEKILTKDPLNAAANNALFDAAIAAGFPEIGTFALETIRQSAPDNTANLHKLAEHFLRQNMPNEAMEIYEGIIRIDSADMDAVKGAKDASARASMAKQKWDTSGGMRELLADSEQAAALERKNRAAMTSEQLLALRNDLSAQYEERSGELPYAREMASVCEKLDDLDDAIQWYSYAVTLSNGDPNLQRKVEILNDRKQEQAVQQLRERAERATDPGEKQQLEEELRGMLAERTERQVAEARSRVEHNPTDKQLRYELGQHLFDAGQYREAIPQLQQARSNPHIRTRAMLLLGKCFEKNNMLDMATNEFSEAIAELSAMDDTKKELLYAMGLVLEKMDRPDDALNAYKQIYNADYGYRDVAEKVEASYAT